LGCDCPSWGRRKLLIHGNGEGRFDENVLQNEASDLPSSRDVVRKGEVSYVA
jgi:hypothetical protein